MSEGRKEDTNKLRFDLLSPLAIFQYAKVLTMGAVKYCDRNWEMGMKWGRIFAALNRHLWRWWIGEKFDPVDGQHHLSSVIWCASALLEYEVTHPELDDRPVYTEEQRQEILKVFESPQERTQASTCVSSPEALYDYYWTSDSICNVENPHDAETSQP